MSAPSKRLFGTDGIRGKAGRAPLDETTIERLGSALPGLVSRGGDPPRVLIGRDTRASGGWIERTLAGAISAGGGRPVAAGILPTAAVAWLTRAGGFDAGLMISASHNPWEDNGIKVFSRDGYKLPDADEARLEAIVLDGPAARGGGVASGSGGAAAERDRGTSPVVGSGAAFASPRSVEPMASSVGAPAPGRTRAGDLAGDLGLPAGVSGPGAASADARDLVAGYLDHLLGATAGARLDGVGVVLDCANGAASRVAPEAFRALGAEVRALSAEPDGRNINAGCGSLHPERLCRAVVETKARFGFAFDGDADRCLMADDRGSLCDGDFIMYRSALMLREAGRLGPDLVVGTVMSNLWLERSLRAAGIELARTPVGDKYVLEEMLRRGARVGGEQSGHVIFIDHATTGDGILTSLLMATASVRSGVEASAWRAEVTPCPQVLLNVRVASRPDLETHPVIGPATARARERLGGDGRVLLRYSGTEPLARVMVEAVDAGLTESLARELAGLIEREIGSGS